MERKALTLALCLFPNVTALDYQGPAELFSFLSPKNIGERRPETSDSPYTIDITYFSHTLAPMETSAGPNVLPMRTYNDLQPDEQFDIILVPGGRNARRGLVPADLIDFVKKQAPGATYVLSVCTGSWILADCGLLDGKRATTNKAAFKRVKAETSDKVVWVPKARWVVDGNIWTSSGVTAGMDMANAFVSVLVGEKIAAGIRASIELGTRQEGDDEFAAIHDLV